ncbi:MAG: hypothetical protein A3B38_02975 [Candidatus Levybacteria bacterium RIFCSPLOWO2_01_FULL_36_13]|nr:MAG: hypothetical protein A2684_04065 [Candidatus Levybacteria bacterium RIFCSPHIGHO2_01_FULL_36_15b]OGH35855.1 MAG: hypothetical protein A3B38_02975 [Candidatus Levybacteria bacterium RIFCSPLOWO2_01_FULL_36_13]
MEKDIQKEKNYSSDVGVLIEPIIAALLIALAIAAAKTYVDIENAKTFNFYPELDCGIVTEAGYTADITKPVIKLNIGEGDILASAMNNEMLVKTAKPFKIVNPANPMDVRIDENGIHLDSISSVLINVNGASYLIEGLPDYQENKHVRITAECDSE